MRFHTWRSKIVEYTDADRVREQNQLRDQDPSHYKQHVQGLSALRPSPRVQNVKDSGQQASNAAALHATLILG